MAIFTNQAQLSYNGSIINSNIAAGEIVEVLSITKTAIINDYTRNDDVTYVISIVNSGTTVFTGVSISDDLGGYVFGTETVYPLNYVDGSVRAYVNGILQPTAPAVTAGPPLTFSGITVPANSNVMIIYEADITRFAPLDTTGEITNTATASAAGITPITASETIETEDAPELTITKSIEPTVITENGTVTYTFIIQNYGNEAAVATDNVMVTDTFDPVLSNIAVTFNGAAWITPAEYTYNETTGAFATVAGQITVPAASYEQDAATGAWVTTPGVSVLTVTGTI